MLNDDQKQWIDSQPDAQTLMRKLVKNRVPFSKYAEIIEYFNQKDDRDKYSTTKT